MRAARESECPPAGMVAHNRRWKLPQDYGSSPPLNSQSRSVPLTANLSQHCPLCIGTPVLDFISRGTAVYSANCAAELTYHTSAISQLMEKSARSANSANMKQLDQLIPRAAQTHITRQYPTRHGSAGKAPAFLSHTPQCGQQPSTYGRMHAPPLGSLLVQGACLLPQSRQVGLQILMSYVPATGALFWFTGLVYRTRP
jgi:D-alanyl-D-alanine dipeptidase